MKDSILVFGGGSLQLSMIRRARLSGFNTIVIDPDADAPGKNIADVFIHVDGDDYETTLKIAKDHGVKGVVTAGTDKPILMMCRIAQEMNLPFPSYNSCETLLNKAKFKAFLKAHNLPHARGEEYFGTVEIEKLNLKFPVITKPITNSGSRGVLKSHNKTELQNAIKETLIYSKDARFLIEEFIEGDEISVEALVQNKKVHIIQLTDKIVTPPPYNVEIGHIQPSKYSGLKDEIEVILQQVVNKSGLDNCALHPEFKIKDNKISVIEIGPRLGGDFITSDLVPLSTGVNMEDCMLLICHGSSFKYSLNDSASMIKYITLPSGNKISKLISKDDLLKEFPYLVDFRFDLKIGTSTHIIRNSIERYGYYIFIGNNIDELKEKMAIIDNYINLKSLNYV